MPKASINVIKKHLPLIQRYKREYPYLSGQKLAMVIKEKENMTIDQDYLRSIINGSAMVKEIEPVNFDEVDFNIELPETLSIERENFKIPAGIDRLRNEEKYQNRDTITIEEVREKIRGFLSNNNLTLEMTL